MRTSVVVPVLAVTVLVGCERPPAPKAPAPPTTTGAETSAWNDTAAASLKSEAEQMFRDIDAGNFDAMIANMDSNVIALDFDAKNKPVRMDGLADARRYFSGYADAMKKGLKMTTTVVRDDCRATVSMGFCVADFDQSASMNGKSMGTYKFRGTLVARREGAAWKWVHWHGSFRELPKPPAVGAPAPPK